MEKGAAKEIDVQHIICQKRPLYMAKGAAKKTHIHGKRSCKRESCVHVYSCDTSFSKKSDVHHITYQKTTYIYGK